MLPLSLPDLTFPAIASGGVACIGVDLKRDYRRVHDAVQSYASAGEIAAAARFHHLADATRHLVGRALARALLARVLGVDRLVAEFALNAWGKPSLPGSGVEFNVTHSGDAVWVAVCRSAPVGIDVEAAAAATDPDALSATLHRAERAELRASRPADLRAAFLRCWTRKEAVIKALGEGLSRPLASFRVRANSGSTGWLVEPPPSPFARWTVCDLPAPAGYHGSVAVMGENLPIVFDRADIGAWAA